MKSIYLLLLLSFSCLFCTDRAERFPTGPVDLSLILNSEERNRFGIGPNSPRREELSLAYPLEQRPAATGDQSWFDWMSGSVVALWGKQENPVEGQEEQDDTDSNDADDFEVVAYTQKQQEILNRPLFVACMRGTKEDILSALACGAQINARDISGNRPLHEAVRYNRYDIIELLLSSGASLSVANNLKITPLMVAIDNGDVKTVSLLLKNGALLSDNRTCNT